MMTFVKNSHPVVPSLFDEFFRTDYSPVHRTHRGFEPAINISEKKDGFLIEVAAPGRQKSDFVIELDKNVLTLQSKNEESPSGEVETEAQEQPRYTQREFGPLNFKRSYKLPKHIDQEGIHANFDNGVLYVWLPKLQEAQLEHKRSINID